MQPMTHRGEEIAVQPTPMSTNYSNSDQTYRIETKTSAGSIEDPITGEQYEIDGYEDGRGGVIEVARPDSAKHIVDSTSRRRFLSQAPTSDAVAKARQERFEFAHSDVALQFNQKEYGTFEEVDLHPAEGFDPKHDAPNNDARMKATKAYRTLLENGHDAEAAYLRVLPNVDTQADFARFVLEQGLISYE